MRTQQGTETGPLFAGALCSAAYLSLLVTVFDAQSVHGSDDGCQGLDGVAVDDRLVLLYVFSREAILVDDPGEKTHTPTAERASALSPERALQA